MTEEFQLGPQLDGLVKRIVDSYFAEPRTRHIARLSIPSGSVILDLTERLLELAFPGFYGRQSLTEFNVGYHVGDLLPRIGNVLYHQIHSCLCYASEVEHPGDVRSQHCAGQARDMTLGLLDRVPEIRELLATDVQAAFDGDPAAENVDEIILAYPGLRAITVHRFAHALYELEVPLLPRIMGEFSHAKTGIDIHPGARIGRHFFIDHGTGVVIGETTEIGNNVKVYQGVTLGALSFPKDDRGNIIRKAKRHPTVEDNVTLYANAIVLGGDTVIGRGAVIGGSVFVTSSVPPNCVVTFTPPELRVRERGGEKVRVDAKPEERESMPDYVI